MKNKGCPITIDPHGVSLSQETPDRVHEQPREIDGLCENLRFACAGNNEVNHVELKSTIPMELEQRHIIKFLHLKGLKLDDIATELANVYGKDPYANPSIKYRLHQLG
jgi:hypothetical protein